MSKKKYRPKHFLIQKNFSPKNFHIMTKLLGPNFLRSLFLWTDIFLDKTSLDPKLFWIEIFRTKFFGTRGLKVCDSRARKSGFETSKWWLEFNYKEALGLRAGQFLVSNPDFLAREPHALSPLCQKLLVFGFSEKWYIWRLLKQKIWYFCICHPLRRGILCFFSNHCFDGEISTSKLPIFKIFKKALLTLFPYMMGTSGANFS